MKQLLFITLFIGTFLISSPLQAQLGLNTGITYAAKADNPGILFGATYKVTEKIAGNAAVTHFFTGSDNLNILQFDLGVRSQWDFTSFFSIYGHAGLNTSFNTYKFGDRKDTATDVGIGLGAGLAYAISELLSLNAGVQKVFLGNKEFIGNIGVTVWFN